jgi:hypothetical protein
VCAVCKSVALTQLGPSLADVCWAARVRVDPRYQSHGYLQNVRGYLFAVWFAGEHCEAESPFPQPLRECGRQSHVDFQVPRTCMHVCDCVCVCVCDAHVCTCACTCEDALVALSVSVSRLCKHLCVYSVGACMCMRLFLLGSMVFQVVLSSDP